jgi:hypothetical protein
MTHVVELRKEQRATNTLPEGRSARTGHLPSTQISPFLQKILGLKPAEES